MHSQIEDVRAMCATHLPSRLGYTNCGLMRVRDTFAIVELERAELKGYYLATRLLFCSASLWYNVLKEDGAMILAEDMRTATRLHTLKYVMTLRCNAPTHFCAASSKLRWNDIKATGTDAIAATLAEATCASFS
jgi:hypothetical protein